MDKALDAGLAGEPGEPGRAGVVNPLKSLRPALAQDADAIDQRLVAGEERGQQPLVVDRDVQDRDLPDIAERHQKLGFLGMAAADRDHVAARGKPLDDVAADEARPAEHRGSAISHMTPCCAPPDEWVGADFL